MDDIVTKTAVDIEDDLVALPSIQVDLIVPGTAIDDQRTAFFDLVFKRIQRGWAVIPKAIGCREHLNSDEPITIRATLLLHGYGFAKVIGVA